MVLLSYINTELLKFGKVINFSRNSLRFASIVRQFARTISFPPEMKKHIGMTIGILEQLQSVRIYQAQNNPVSFCTRYTQSYLKTITCVVSEAELSSSKPLYR